MQSQNSYLALGDSYTVGESVPSEKTWPYLIADFLNQKGIDVLEPKVIAKTGWRTDELITAIDDTDLKSESYDLVSLLIGVNNQYQEKPINQFTTEFEILLKKAIAFNKNGVQTTFVVGIPDYSITPYALKNDKENADQEIKKYNKIAQLICEKYNVDYYPIFKLSRAFKGKENCFVDDELHPSAIQYQKWFDSFKDDVFRLVN
jgi:lysophospholipase L1-like esterase